jgi:hypothetical protein
MGEAKRHWEACLIHDVLSLFCKFISIAWSDIPLDCVAGGLIS